MVINCNFSRKIHVSYKKNLHQNIEKKSQINRDKNVSSLEANQLSAC